MAGAEMKIEINEYDREWKKVAGQSFTMQKSFFNPHDFAISQNYYVFFQNAMSFKMVRCFSHDPSVVQCCKLAQDSLLHLPASAALPCLLFLSQCQGRSLYCSYAVYVMRPCSGSAW